MPFSWFRSRLTRPEHSQQRRIVTRRAISLVEALFAATAFALATCTFIIAASGLLWLNTVYAPSLNASLALVCRIAAGMLTVALVAAPVFAMRALLDPFADRPTLLGAGDHRARSCFASKGPDAAIIATSTSSWDGG